MALDAATTRFLSEMVASGMKPLHEMTPLEARGLTAAGIGHVAERVDRHLAGVRA